MENNNILVQYKGGGYDGCFWAWNYFIIDKDSNFHDVASSGRKGITTKEGATELLDNDDTKYIYKLSDEKSIREFEVESNPGHVIGATNKVAELIESGVKVDPLYWHCDDCGVKMEGEGNTADYSGCGGVEVQANTKLCDDCLCNRMYDEEDDEDDD